MSKGSADARLLMLALAADGAELTGAALVWLWKRFSLPGRLSQRIREMESSTHLSRTGAGRIDRRIFRITKNGQKALLGNTDPKTLWQREWDGHWRLVVFDIPEHQNALRTKLRRRLQQARFGWLQNSVWISPDAPDENLIAIKSTAVAAASLTMLRARPAGGESDADLVEAAWDFPRIANDYQAYRKVLRGHPGPTAGLEEWLKWLKFDHAAWRQITARDPFLPVRLLPEGYAGQQAWAERTRAYERFTAALRRAAGATC